MAQAGGVLNRAGHTEAGCDLARLAGVEPAAVIVEILNEDGSMARRADLETFAAEHKLKIGTIADLIHYRIQHENTLERVSECAYPTDFGDFRLFAYQDRNDNNLHIALVMGDISGEEPVLVRVHARNVLDDIFSSKRGESSLSIRSAMEKISNAGRGVLVLIRQSETNQALAELIHGYQLVDNGHHVAPNNDVDWRTTGTGARILVDLGVKKLKVLGSQKKYVALSGFDLEVAEHVA
jgi:3,4-dihydroxy 2-butanone 4-phosphate synthase/GTP cyclohydrolase II